MPTASDEQVNRELGQFRDYLETLTYLHIDPRLRAGFGFSDIVQKTLLEAYLALQQIRELSEPAQRQYLSRMLTNNLLDEVERITAGKRDRRLERSLEEAVENSSCRLRDWLAGAGSAPDARLIREEQAQALLEALTQLPARQREALMLQKYHGWKLAQIAQHMDCTIGAVAGMHAHGLKRLRELLADREGQFDV